MTNGNDIPVSNLDAQIEKLMNCEIIKESEVKALCNKYKELLSNIGNVHYIRSPVTVCSSLSISLFFSLSLLSLRFSSL